MTGLTTGIMYTWLG